MKQKSIFTIFAALTMVLGFAMTTVGQTNITASANVVATVSVAAGNNLQFGNLTVNSAKTVGNNDNMLQGSVNGGPAVQTGTWTVGKGQNSQVNLTFTLAANLTGTGAPMVVSYADYTGGIKLGAIGSVDWTPASGSVNVTSGAYPTEYAATSFVVHVGGTVTADVGQVVGAYTGTQTLSAVYN
jgi:hypothetical protein